MSTVKIRQEVEAKIARAAIREDQRALPVSARTITLKFPGRCADCGATLEVGTRARWYGRGKVYGTTCHSDSRQGSKYHKGDVQARIAELTEAFGPGSADWAAERAVDEARAHDPHYGPRDYDEHEDYR